MISRARVRDTSRLRKAAGFLVVAALAGTAYAAPGSPVPGLVRRILGRAVAETPVTLTHTPPPGTANSGVAVTVGNRTIVEFKSTQPEGQIVVTRTDAARLEVRAAGDGVSYTSREGVLEVSNEGSRASYAIMLPRSAPLIEIRVAGRRVLLKEGGNIIVEAPPSRPGVFTIPLTPPD